jgi:hypothetical protein
MANTSLPKERPARRGRLLLALAEAEDRFRHELLDVEERELLRERVIQLRRKLAATSRAT